MNTGLGAMAPGDSPDDYSHKWVEGPINRFLFGTTVKAGIGLGTLVALTVVGTVAFNKLGTQQQKKVKA